MRLLLLSASSILLLILTGCVSQREFTQQQEIIVAQANELDSLRAVEQGLWDHLKVLQDSIQFYDDIDSGRYYRELGRLHDQIERLEFEIAVSQDGGRTIATLATDDLFQSGTAELSEAGKSHLDEIALQLKETYEGRHFRVEGHSDSIPVGTSMKEKYPTNWELSAARAASVVRYLLEIEGLKPEQFEVVSFGLTRPIASNASNDGRRQNRRIRIAVLPELITEKEQ